MRASIAGAQFEHQRGVDDVLAGRAPMHVARGCRIGLGDLGGQRVDQRDGDVAGGRGRLGQRREVVALGLGGSAIRSAGERGMTPTAASARASATSKSSMRCNRARSSRMARMAALEISGVSSEEGASGLVMAVRRGETPIAACRPPPTPGDRLQDHPLGRRF